MKAKKSLGQHWLTNQAVLEKMIAAAQLRPEDIVIEVGPGTGNLTKRLLAAASRVIAVEKDGRLIKALQQTFAPEIASGKLLLIPGDILEHSPKTLGLGGQSYKVVANLPYYLTGQFLRQFLGADPQPEQLVLLLQKEVVERIVAARQKESLLSLSIKVFGTPHYFATVKAGSFSPVPKIDSAILVIENVSRRQLTGINEEKFFTLLRQGFAHKRKLLKNNLRLSAAELGRCQLLPQARAEDLTLENWLCLARATA